MAQICVDQRGNHLELGEPLKAGGEGSVFRHPLNAEQLVKVYHDRNKIESEKLTLATRLAQGSSKLQTFAAWPISLVFEYHTPNRVIGFTMPRFGGYPIHAIYSPRDRKQELPQHSWKWLIHVAKNAAAAFHQLHQHGVVMGDVNESNFLVHAETGLVHLIDCDSYQITWSEQTYRCPVGVDTWTPPELQNRSFGEVDRSVQHDLFGLAVLIFHLLFLGRHPYNCAVAQDGGPAEAIQMHYFPYSQAVQQTGVKPPPQSLSPQAVGSNVFNLFEQAFLAGSSFGFVQISCTFCGKGNRIQRAHLRSSKQIRCGSCHSALRVSSADRRPTAEIWVKYLNTLEISLVQCNENPRHYYLPNTGCRLCKLEGYDFFPFVPAETQPQTGRGTEHIEELFTKINTWRSPQFPLPSPDNALVSATPLPEGISKYPPLFIAGIIISAASLLTLGISEGVSVLGVVAGVGISITVWLSSAYHKEAQKRYTHLNTAKQATINLEQSIQNLDTELKSRVTQRQEYAHEIYNTLKHLPSEYQTELRRLEQQKEQILRNRYLQTKLLHEVKIPGIGQKRLAMLRAMNIDSALGILSARSRPKGIPAEAWQECVTWAKKLEIGFRPPRDAKIPKDEIARLDQKFSAKQQKLEKEIKDALQQLQQDQSKAEQKYQSLKQQLEVAYKEKAQAEADVAVLDT